MSIEQDVRPGLEAELGAGLLAALEDVEPAALEGEQLAAYVRACWRVQSRASSMLFEALHHLGRAEAGRTARRPGLDEFSGDEGLDQLPGSVPGYGMVLAHDARTMLTQRHHGEWRIVLTDHDGRLQHVLLARRRPARPRGPTRHRARGRAAKRTIAIVELQGPTAVLAALHPDDHGDWAPLLAELQARLPERDAPGRPPDADAGPDQQARRRPGAELDRWIRVRDRHCIAPGCRRPAHRAELDHTRDHALGGPTSSWNLGAFCTHDHRAKHVAGWTVTQPTPGRFVLRTRAGITHTTQPRRVTEALPTPRPAASPRPLPDDGRPDTDDEPIDPDWLTKIAPRVAATHRNSSPATTSVASTTSDSDEPPF